MQHRATHGPAGRPRGPRHWLAALLLAVPGLALATPAADILPEPDSWTLILLGIGLVAIRMRAKCPLSHPIHHDTRLRDSIAGLETSPIAGSAAPE